MVLGSLAVFADEDELVTVYGENLPDGTIMLKASSSHVIPVYLSVDLPRLVNLEADVTLPFGIQLDPGATDQDLFLLRPTTNRGQLGYGISYSFARGNPYTADHDDDHLYLFPFEHGTKRRLSQGFGGRFSHYGENEYAVDFEMPEGTPILAARGGVVAEVKEDSTTGGRSMAYSASGNYVLIAHSDGSFGNYVHLQPDGAVVEPGDSVEEGDLIGYSGNTGRSSGPHLHFDVRIPQPNGRMQSIPFLFRGDGGSAEEPIEGRFYYSYHPGGAEFVPILGRDIEITDYADYAVTVEAGDGVEIRIEQIDLTFLVFVQNQRDRKSDVELQFQLTGMQSAAGPSLVLEVPAQTELLATILRPVPGATRIQYGYSIRYR
jgi:murein DD-endopeptidase MepM/ murein hydrolase activator NlpD